MNTTVGNKLRILRKQKGFSQEQTADYLHISQSAYQRVENGKSTSWATIIQPICSLFEIEPEDLLKQDSIIISQNQQGGESNNAYIINQLSEKLINQYEARIEDLKELVAFYKKEVKN